MSAAIPRATPLAAALALALYVLSPSALGALTGKGGSSLESDESIASAPASEPLDAYAESDDLLAVHDRRRGRKATMLGTVEVIGENIDGYEAERSSTATRTDTPLIDIPQSITVITQEMIRDQAMQGLSEVVRYVPGMGMAQGEGNRDAPIIRGNNSTADMFIDGMRDDVQYYRDLYNIDRVEALKGPNAMIFGRGGSGGLLNRVSKQADWNTIREIGIQVGSWDKLRLTGDFGQAINAHAAFRVPVLVEDTDSFRDGVSAKRRGINPMLAFSTGEATTISLGVEHFEEERTADRGIPSLQGRPVDVDPSTFFGDPERSEATAEVNAFNAVIEHEFGNGVTLLNRTRYAVYDKFYQNVFPGSVYADETVSISAYNNVTQRDNLFNQTDLTFSATTGSVEHTLLVGAELGRQETDNLRETGYFPANRCPVTSSTNSVTTACVPLSNPIYEGPIDFHPGASDADNSSVARAAAVYVQDQFEFSPQWQAILGLRYDHFEVDLTNNRTGGELASSDNLLSPRAGLIYKPRENVSLYASYSIAYLPRSGEQLASLTLSNAALEPEEFQNLELGAKWEIRPDLSATVAIYQLERSNVAIVNPDNPTELILADGDSQRVRGLEFGLAGKLTDNWSLMGGYAWQDGEITQAIRTSPTAVIPEGTTLAQVPEHTFSLWNRYDFNPQWGLGLGVVSRSSMFASTSNAVTLPGFTRLDGALFFELNERVQLQLNVENLLDRNYYASAHSDNNISPGSPRAFNLGLNLSF